MHILDVKTAQSIDGIVIVVLISGITQHYSTLRSMMTTAATGLPAVCCRLRVEFIRVQDVAANVISCHEATRPQ